MNKSEVIRKISKKAGVPDTEAKKFFEIFLKNATDILKPGESLKISDVGLFQLRVGQIESRTTKDTGDKFIYSDLIVFIDSETDEQKEGEKEIIFNVPSGIKEVRQPVDSYFSLSIGKPIIPLKGASDSEFFIPPSGNELKGLIDSKLERLIEEAEKIQGGKETETIHLNPEAEGIKEPPDRNKPDTDNTTEEIEVPLRSDFMKTREFENLSWDFGENLSQEIEEKSTADDTGVTTEAEAEEVSIVYEPETESDEQSETEPVFEEENLYDEEPDEDIFEEIIDDEAEEDVFENTASEVTRPETESLPDEKKDVNSEKSNVTENDEAEKLLTAEETEEDHVPLVSGQQPEEPPLKNFQRVKSLTKEFNSSDFNDTDEIEEEIPKKITEVRGGYQKVRRTTAEFDFDLSGIKGLDEIEEPAVEKKKSASRDYQGYRKQSRVPSLIVAFIVVIALGIVIFLYMKMKSINHEATGSDQSVTAKQETTVIERDYDVPVTYPYDKPDQESKTEIKQTVNDQPADKENSTGTVNPVEKKGADLSLIREPVNAERIGNYIYQYPDGIVVQLSSWKSKSIAVSEVKKYRNAGYTAFAETSVISGKGLYYRVRVGYFSSIREAENFLNGNQ